MARCAVTAPFRRGTDPEARVSNSFRPLDAGGDSAARFPYHHFHAPNFGFRVEL